MIAVDSLMHFSQEFLQGALINKMSKQENLSFDETQSGLKSVVPVIYSALAEKGSKTGGANIILELIKSHSFDFTLSSLPLMSEDTVALKNIFDKDLPLLISEIEMKTGLERDKIIHLMNFVTNQLLVLISAKVKKENLDTQGLAHFLNTEGENLAQMGVRNH